MSQSDNQILQVVVVDDDEEVGGGGGGEGGGGVDGNHEEKKKKKKQRGFDCTRNIRRAKQVVLSKLKQKRKPKPPHQSNLLSSSATANSPPSGTTTSTKGYCFCFKKPLTLESPVDESLCSDPDDPRFSYDMLKSFIENNDFYSKESNPHLHVPPD